MREGHVSLWPKYIPDKPRARNLAIGMRLYDEKENTIGYRIIDENESHYDIFDHDNCMVCIRDNSYDLYISELYGKNGYLWLDSALNGDNCTAIVANSSKLLVNLSFKLGRSSYRIASSGNWGNGVRPTTLFLSQLRGIFNTYGHGVHTSPSGLGYYAILDFMQHENVSKFSRPNHMLRSKLRQYSSGGRSDDFSLSEQYKLVYEEDRNNSYAASAIDGVPTHRKGHLIGKGLEDVYNSKLASIRGYALCFCQAKITIPQGFRGKFSPFYRRTDDGLLEWVTKPGTYTGYWWSPMLQRCEKIGFDVHLARCWCFTELDTFLREWALNAISMRSLYKSQGKQFEEDVFKSLIVGAIGRFGMSNETLYLTTEEKKQPGDEMWLNLNVWGDESMCTPYYLHKEIDYDANHLTQVASAIIMFNNLALYDRALEEEHNGNTVISTNYDAIFLTQHPSLPLGMATGEWKVKQHTNFKQHGRRSYDSDQVSRRPGVPIEGRKK